MMTSLAKQLQRLAVPHTQAIFSEDKRRPSLLFDSKEAASLDREAVFAIGQSGLEELENLDTQFIDYEESLFSLSSQTWERSLQTKEVNEQLNENIRRFLILLSPYFPLKSAHKALEWLIYRYHIHLYNKDDLLLCVLPYHEMKVFVRITQMLKLEDPSDKWTWLEPAAKNGIPLAKNTLINHCRKDAGFMAFILDIVPMFIKVHGSDSSKLRAVMSLYTCAMLGALRHKHDITEQMMSVVVPRLIQGLRSKCVSYKAASYMVLSQLLVQTPLKEDLLQSLLPILTKHIPAELLKEALCCVILMYQMQNITSMPKKAFRHLCKVPGLVVLLSELSVIYNVDSLLKVWLKRLVTKSVERGEGDSYSSSSDGMEDFQEKPHYTAILQGILMDVHFVDQKIVEEITSFLLMKLIEKRVQLVDSKDVVIDWQMLTKRLLMTLEQKYTKAFDQAIQDVMSQIQEDEALLTALEDMMALTNSPLKYSLVSDASTSLLLGLNHPSAAVRILTLGHLAKCLNENQDSNMDFVEDLLLQRLEDDNVKVIEAVLNLDQLLLKVVTPEKLLAAILNITKKKTGKLEWVVVMQRSLRMLCQMSDTHGLPDLTFDLLPHLLIYKQNMEFVEVLINHAKGDLQEILAPSKKLWLDIYRASEGAKPAKLDVIVIECLKTYLSQLSMDICMEKVAKMFEKSKDDVRYLLLVVCVLCKIITDVPNVCLKIPLLEHLMMLQHSLATSVVNRRPPKSARTFESLFTEWLSGIDKDTLSSSLLLWCCHQLVRAVSDIQLKDVPSFFCSEAGALPLISLIDFLMKQFCNDSKEAWQLELITLVEEGLSADTVLKLFCHVWSSYLTSSNVGGCASAVTHVGSYHLLSHLLTQKQFTDNMNIDEKSPALYSLMMSLLHPQMSVRHAALQCLQKLKEFSSGSLGVVKALVSRLLKQKNEIAEDPKHVSMVFGKYFGKLVDEPDLKTADIKMAALQSFVVWISDQDTPIVMKTKIMDLLSEVPSQLLLNDITPTASDIINLCKAGRDDLEAEHMTLIRQIFCRIDDTAAEMIKSVDSPILKTLVQALGVPGVAPQLIAIKQINRGFFSALNNLSLQQYLVSRILDVGEQTASSAVSSEVHSCLNKLKLKGQHVSHELHDKDSSQATTVKGKKKTRRSVNVHPLNYKRVTICLEVLQTRRKIKDREDMATLLFDLLVRLSREDEEDTEYCRQLVLSCLYNLCSRWTEETKPEKQETFNIDILVQCIRTSGSPQTQQQALMVMSAIAPLYPEYILHNVMSIFTFMGSTLLQQDDAYSFHIISNTIDKVIPAIIKTCSERGTPPPKERTLIQNILRVFVDARHYIPKHRAMMLFRQLTERVGVVNYLGTMMVLLMESAVRMKDVPPVPDSVVDVTEEGKSVLDKDIDFTGVMSGAYGAGVQLEALCDVLQCQTSLAAHLYKQDHGAMVTKGKKKEEEVPILSVDSLSVQSQRLVLYHCTRLVIACLTRQDFVAQVLEQTPGEVMSDEMKDHFKTFLEKSLSLLTGVAKGSGSQGNTQMSKFWKAMMHKVYEVLDKYNYLLPTSVFLTVISDLLEHTNPSIQRKVLEMLNSKLQVIRLEDLSKEEVESLLLVLPKLYSVAKLEAVGTEGGADNVTISQMGLYSLKLMCKLLGEKHPKQFLELFTIALEIMTDSSQPPAMLGSAILCIAELSANLQAQALPYLPKFMPPLLALLKNMELLKKQELLLVCCLAMIQKTVGALPHFLSPYLQQLLVAVCHISSLVEHGDGSKKSQPAVRLRAVRHQLATAVSPRVLVTLLSAVENSLIHPENSRLSEHCILTLFDTTIEHVENMSKEDLMSQHASLVSFFCDSLDLRNKVQTLRNMKKVEDRALDMVVAMVMKLSEKSFRPMFYKIYDWAFREESAFTKQRQLTFFRLAERLSETLKGLFNLFIGHAIKVAVQLLDKNNTMHGDVDFFGKDEEGEEMSCSLLGNILGCLHKCFLHDNEGFVTKETFKILLQPLVDQVENMVGGEDVFQARITDCVKPCLGQFAVASRDESSWKALNYQLLLKARHSSPEVRYATLECVEKVASNLGDEYMNLLPETVPFLAELMEDDSEVVEQKCQQVVTSLEALLGESIQQYF